MVALVQVGEKTGMLAEVFGELERYYARAQKLRRDFWARITWPLFQFSGLIPDRVLARAGKVYPGRPLRMSANELGPLLLVKRTWRARWAALRLARRMVVGALKRQDLRGSGGAMQGRLYPRGIGPGSHLPV